MLKQTTQTFTGKPRSPAVAENWVSTASLMAVSRVDRVYDSDQNRKDYCIKWLYISSKWDVKKEHKQKTESVILLAAARFFFWIPTGGWNYYWEPQWHIWLIIIKHSHPPQHDAATLLCLMKINNAVVWSAMISH